RGPGSAASAAPGTGADAGGVPTHDLEGVLGGRGGGPARGRGGGGTGHQRKRSLHRPIQGPAPAAPGIGRSARLSRGIRAIGSAFVKGFGRLARSDRGAVPSWPIPLYTADSAGSVPHDGPK